MLGFLTKLNKIPSPETCPRRNFSRQFAIDDLLLVRQYWILAAKSQRLNLKLYIQLVKALESIGRVFQFKIKTCLASELLIVPKCFAIQAP